MTTAMTTDCFTGLVRAVGMLLFVIVSSEFIYFLLFSATVKESKENYVFNPGRLNLFSGAFFNVKENSACNPYRFKNAKLIAKAMSFIFFMNPCKYHSSIPWRISVAREDVSANPGTRKITTCL